MTVELKNVSIYADNKQLVYDVNLIINPHERVGLIGGSGSGKSLITKAILGILPRTLHIEGDILIDGRNIRGFSDDDYAQLRGTYMTSIFQNPLLALNPVKTVEHNIELPLTLHYRLDKDDKRRRVEQALQQVNLETEFLHRYPSELSGGQAQRVAIAQALIAHPHLLIADEPTTALDSLVQQHIIDLLVHSIEKTGTSLLFVSHDFSVISRTADRCYVIYEGRVVEEAQINDLLRSPKHPYTQKLVKAACDLSLSSSSNDIVNGDGMRLSVEKISEERKSHD